MFDITCVERKFLDPVREFTDGFAHSIAIDRDVKTGQCRDGDELYEGGCRIWRNSKRLQVRPSLCNASQIWHGDYVICEGAQEGGERSHVRE